MTDEIVIDPMEGEKPPRTWDFFLTIFLLLLLLVLTGIFVVSGFGMGLSVLGCAEAGAGCNGTVISAGRLLAIFGTPIIGLAGFVTTIVFIARRKLSFLVALIACLASVGVFLLGSWLVDLAVPAG